jgi:hypothetical protein
MDAPRDRENEYNAVNADRFAPVLQGITHGQRAVTLTSRAPAYPRPMKPAKPCAGMKQAVPIWLDR